MMRSPTFVNGDSSQRFLDLFVRGVPQIDLWNPINSPVPRPTEPQRPTHRRPDRPLPPHPLESVEALLTDDESDLYFDIRTDEALEDCNLFEYFNYSKSSPHCAAGYRLCAESAADAIEGGHPPSWFDSKRFTADTLASLRRKMSEAERAYDIATRDHMAEVMRIQRAPDADPAWRAYDEAVAAWPATWADYLERVRAHAAKATGYATKEEAEAEWGRRARAEHAALTGGVR